MRIQRIKSVAIAMLLGLTAPVLLLLLLPGRWTPPVLAATITPDVFTDDNTDNGNCTLREAIIAANTNASVDTCPAGQPGLDVITLSAGTYVLTVTGINENAAATGDLDILEDLTITGVSSATTIIDAAGLSDRVFHIIALSDTINFQNVQIVNGQTITAFAHGAGIFLDQGALTVSDSRIANNQTVGAGSGGGGIYGGGGTIVLTNTEILSNSANALGGGIQVAIAPLVGNNIRIENNTANTGGGGINADNVTLNRSEVISNEVTGAGGGGGINAGTLVMTDTIVASNTSLGNGGGLSAAVETTIADGLIFGNTAGGNGGGVYVAGGPSVTIKSTLIYSNIAISQGGGLHINSGAVQMLASQIDYNQAQNGGGVWVTSGSVFTLTSSTVAYNSAPSFPGGGLWVGGTVLINGSQVVSNSSGNSGGGFVIGSGGVVELTSGQIDYNQASGAGAGLWVTNGAVFTQTGGTVAYNSTPGSGGGLWVQGTAWLNGGQVLGNSSTGGSGGGLYLTTNGQVILDGGQVVSNSSAFSGGGFYVGEITNTLTINSGTIGYNTAANDGGGVNILNGTVTLNGGQIISNSTTSSAGSGGGVFVDNSTATFTQTGGDIAGNQVATNGVGGAVAVRDGSFSMSGGRLYDNSVLAGSGGGGGLWINSGSTNLTGGQIISNSAPVGGGIFLQSGTIDLNGTDVLSNATTSDGGGVYHWGTGTITQTSLSDVAYNSSGLAGGGVYVRINGAYLLSGGRIISNTAQQGGGVFIAQPTAVFTHSNGLIAYNTALTGGGGLYVLSGTLAMSGGSVENNVAQGTALNDGGGGLYLHSGTALLTGGQINYNQAHDGGGIAVAWPGAVLTQTGLFTVAHNQAAQIGGGIGVRAGVASFDGVRVLTNTAGLGGGAVRQTASGQVTLNNGCIVGNSDAAFSYIAGPSPIDATGNWWGAANGPGGVAPGSGDSVSADVDFSGFLTTAPPGCPMLPLLQLLATGPAANAVAVSSTATITAGFDAPLAGATVTSRTFFVHSDVSGHVSQMLGVAGTQAQLTPPRAFEPGEKLAITLNSDIRSSGGARLQPPYVWQFRAAVGGGAGLFIDSGQRLGISDTWDVALGDLDGDGDLDAFLANAGPAPNQVWRNIGGGAFVDTGQTLGNGDTGHVALGDVDNDGDLDAFESNCCGEANRVWFNDGSGLFTDSGQSLGSADSGTVVLGDLDGDGDLDAFVATDGGGNQIWFNDGSGAFTDSGQSLGSNNTEGAALGDVDNDGDLDVFTANRSGQGNSIWLNNGLGQMFDSEQSLGSADSQAVELGDLDGDGDLDAFVANLGGGDAVWLNQGGLQGGSLGVFAPNGQTLAVANGQMVTLGDLDGDGDLDAVTGNAGQPAIIWRNDGAATFFQVNVGVTPTAATRGLALGDLDGDGSLDAFVGNIDGQANYVWLNTLPPDLEISKTATPNVALSVDTVTFTISFTNSGSYTSSNVVISDTLPAQVVSPAVVSSGVALTQTGAAPDYAWQINRLSPGQSGVITITGQISSSGDTIFTNTVQITGSLDVDLTNNADATGVTVQTLDLALLKVQRTPNFVVAPGETVTYTLIYTNVGSATASQVFISDTVSTALDNLSFSSSGPPLTQTGAAPNYIWQLSDLLPGQGGIITLTGVVSASALGSTFVNTATIYTTGPNPDSFLANNFAGTLPHFVGQPGLVITETGGSTAVAEGGVSDSYQLALTSLPGAPVSISISTDGQTTVQPAVLTFTNITWSIPQTVQLFAVDDNIPEYFHTGWLTHTPNSILPAYNALSLTFTTAITDNDAVVDLLVQKSAEAFVPAGGVINYVITVTNIGPWPATNLIITDTLPGDGISGLTAAELTPPGRVTNYRLAFEPPQPAANELTAAGVICLPTGNIFRCEVDSLAPSGLMQLFIEYTPASSGTLVNTVEARSQEPDLGVQPNTDVVTTTVANVNGDVQLEKTASASAVTAGQSLVYTLTVSNIGVDTMTGIRLEDRLPTGIDLIDVTVLDRSTLCNVAGNVLVCDRPSLSPETQFQVVLSTTVAGAANNISVVTNTAVVSTAFGTDTNLANNRASVVTSIASQNADLSLSKLAPAGEVTVGQLLTYTLRVTNAPGVDAAALVHLLDALPPALHFKQAIPPLCSADNGLVDCVLGNLQPGQNQQILLVVTATAAGVVTNTAVVTSKAGLDLTPADNSSSAVVTVQPLNTTVSPALSATLTFTMSNGSPVQIFIPAGAVSQTVEFRYGPLAQPPTPPPGLALAGPYFSLTAYTNGQMLSSFVFSRPITITLTYTDSDLLDIVDESSLRLYYFKNGLGNDAACRPPLPFPAQNRLKVAICHLTDFALLGQTPTSPVFLPVILKGGP